MRDLPQQDHADIGLIENDNTEDMRRAPAATEALQEQPPHHHGNSGGIVMSTIPTITEPGVPPGAEPDMWVGGQRDVYSQVGYVATSGDLLKCPAITVVGEQRTNGHLGQVQVVLDVALTQSNAELTATQARELAALLVAGADLADVWCGRPAAGRRDCDLLEDRPLPVGVTAGEWSIDDAGHLYRELSDGRRQDGRGEITGEPSLPVQLSAVKAALLSFYDEVKTLPGNAGSYVRAALDSISDASEVLR